VRDDGAKKVSLPAVPFSADLAKLGHAGRIHAGGTGLAKILPGCSCDFLRALTQFGRRVIATCGPHEELANDAV